nr:hypothetical protein [Mycoplasmopsis bovis]
MTKVKKHKNDKVTTVSTIGLLKASLKFMSANEKKSLIYGLVLSFLKLCFTHLAQQWLGL